MIVCVDLSERDIQRINELKPIMETNNRSQIIRAGLSELHKKNFQKNLTTVRKKAGTGTTHQHKGNMQ